MTSRRFEPDVSVVVPVHNAESSIERCIRGLLAQDLPGDRFEVLMVDNNSTDRSAEIVRRYPQVRLLRETRQGAYAARNRGLEHARRDLVAFTDPDCVPEPDWLATLIAPFADDKVLIVNGRTLPAGNSKFLRILTAYEHHRDLYIFASRDPTLYFGHTNNLAMRRSVIESQGSFLERTRGSDAVLVRQVTDRFGCAAVRYEPLARVAHLEMDGLAAYFRKALIYRSSRASYSRVTFKRTPTPREQFLILRSAIRSGDLSLISSLPALGLLTAAAVYSLFGVLSHRLNEHAA